MEDRSGPTEESVQSIDVRVAEDVRYWCKELGITPEQLRHAVEVVGSSAEKVRAFLH